MKYQMLDDYDDGELDTRDYDGWYVMAKDRNLNDCAFALKANSLEEAIKEYYSEDFPGMWYVEAVANFANGEQGEWHGL